MLHFIREVEYGICSSNQVCIERGSCKMSELSAIPGLLGCVRTKLGAKFQLVEVIDLEFGCSDPQGRPDKKTYAKF